MKKIVFVAMMALALSACERGSYFNSDTPQLTGDRTWRLEAMGTDLRVYEFTPLTTPSKQCVFVAGENKGGLSCFDKTPKEIK